MLNNVNPETQLLFVPLVWVVVPILFMILTGKGLCWQAKAWWAMSLPIYLGWLYFNNPIVRSYVYAVVA